MKTKSIIQLTSLLLLATFNLQLSTCLAGTTIDIANRYAYGANVGWLDAFADGGNGAVISDYTCSGYIYAANIGWISLGGGSPANGIRYQNLATGDFGVNNDGLGNLRGYAYGANVGWINFEATGAPKVDLVTGNLSGYAYSANCGWISLSNAVAFVQTDHILPGTMENGLPIAWEMENFGVTGIDPNADPDHDGSSNLQEYLAGTNPNDANDYLHITSFQRGLSGTPTRLDMVWTSKPTRKYAIQYRPDLLPASTWTDSVVLGLGVNNDAWLDANKQEFYRIRAFRPLP